MAAFPVPRRSARIAAALIAVLALLPAPCAFAAGPAGASPRPAAVTADAARPFRLDLADDDDYVRQTNFVQCVGASVQMMLNIQRPGADRTARTQRRLQGLARGLSGPRPDGSVRQGAGVFGWAAALDRRGGGAYAVVGADSLQGAMRIAARAIVDHRRPVGLLVWRGRHAWVMSGFEATRDPRKGSFRVTRAYVLDPLHPHGSSAWGPSPRPGTSVSVATVGRQFVHRDRDSHWNSLPGMKALAGKWVLVVPVEGPQPANPAVPRRERDTKGPSLGAPARPAATPARAPSDARFRIR